MVDVGRRSLAIAAAKRKRREERTAGLIRRFGTTVIPLEAKGRRIPRFGTEPGVFDVRLRRFLTPREVVQRRVKQIVTKAKSDVKALKKEEILELKKLQTTLKTITPTKKELQLRLKKPPTPQEKAAIAKGDVLESKIKNLNKEVEDIEQTKTNLLNALDQAQRTADVTKAAQLRLEIDKLRGRIANAEKRRVDVEADRQKFNAEIRREIAKTKTIKEIEEIEQEKPEPKKKTTFIAAAPTKEELIEKVEIPFAKIGKTFPEFKKSVIEAGEEFKGIGGVPSKFFKEAGISGFPFSEFARGFQKLTGKPSEFFAPSKVSGLSKDEIIAEFSRKKFVEPKTKEKALAAIGRAVAGTGEFFETGITGVGFLAERGVRGFGRITGKPLEVKVTVPTKTAQLVRGAATIPILGAAFEAIQVSPVKGQPATSELTLRRKTFVEAAKTAAEIELLTVGAGTRFVAGKAGTIAKTVSKIPSRSKAGLGEVVARVKAKLPKTPQTLAEIKEEVQAGVLTLEEFKKGGGVFFRKPTKPLTKFEKQELLEGFGVTPTKSVRVFEKTKFKEVERELERLSPEKIGRPEQRFKAREFDIKPKEPLTKEQIAEFEEFVKTRAIREITPLGKPKKRPLTALEKEELKTFIKEFKSIEKGKKAFEQFRKPLIEEGVAVETFFKKKTPLTFLEKEELGVLTKEFEATERARRIFKRFKKPTVEELIELETAPSRKQKEISAARLQFKKIIGKAKAKGLVKGKGRAPIGFARQIQEGAKRLLEAEERALVKLVGKEKAKQIQQGAARLLKDQERELKELIGEELGSFPRPGTQFERTVLRLKQLQARGRKLPPRPLRGRPKPVIEEEEILFGGAVPSEIQTVKTPFPILRPRGIEGLVSKQQQILGSARKQLEKFKEVSGLKELTKVSELKALKEASLLKTGLATLSGTKVAEALKSASAQAELLKSASRQAQRLRSPERVLTKTLTKGLTTTRTVTRPKEITKPKEIPKIKVPPLIILPADKDRREKKKKKVPGFHSFVKEEPFKTSKFRRVSKKPRPLANAEERTFKVADNTISQTTEARPTKTLVPPEPPPKKSLRDKFRQVKVSGKKTRHVEKRGFAIDTAGEKQKLKVSAFLARERKRASGLPARKTKGFKKSKGLQGRKRKGGFL